MLMFSAFTNVSQAVYGTLFEAEHRSTFDIPYWKVPFMNWIVPRQRKFQSDLKVINDCLDGLIKNAKETREVSCIIAIVHHLKALVSQTRDQFRDVLEVIG